MTWHSSTYRLAPEAKPGRCDRALSTANPHPCPNQATCGFTSIEIETGNYRYTERCDECSVRLAGHIGIQPPGLKEAMIFPIDPSDPQSQCESCRSPIHWVTTPKGRKMPTDPNGVSHFVTCPGASAHRKPK